MSELTYREGLRQALKEKMEGDPRVFILGEDVGAYGGAYSVTRGLQEEFGPERVRETPSRSRPSSAAPWAPRWAGCARWRRS